MDSHNHEFQAEAGRFGPHAVRLGQDVHLKIASYADGNFTLQQLMFLLQRDFPQRTFYPRVVSNAIQKARRSRLDNMGDSEAASLVQVLERKKCEDKEWFFKVARDQEKRLIRIFWMSPSQRVLYSRYRDVVLNDNTSNTNRFKMFLNVFAVVDSDGKSRLAEIGRAHV